MNPVEVLETRYFPLLDRAAAKVREQHPTFRVTAASVPVGAATASQGHLVYLEAWRPNSTDPEPNCLALEIGVHDLSHTPTLSMLHVEWGGDGIRPMDGLDFLPAEIFFALVEALQIIDEALPQLLEHFDRCLLAWEVAFPQRT
jgi:hypothetical protein